MAKFRKKPVVIEAVHFDGSNREEIERFMPTDSIPAWGVTEAGFFINTLEGVMHVSAGDWVIKGVNGEFYPCNPEIFEKTYEAI